MESVGSLVTARPEYRLFLGIQGVESDEFNQRVTEKSRLSDPTERLQYAEKLKDYLEIYG